MSALEMLSSVMGRRGCPGEAHSHGGTSTTVVKLFCKCEPWQYTVEVVLHVGLGCRVCAICMGTFGRDHLPARNHSTRFPGNAFDLWPILQVAANIGKDRLKGPVLLGPSGRPVVKMFVFAPAQFYDLMSQVQKTAS
jgi:hypothetical protein